MDEATETALKRVFELLTRVRTFHCHYQDLSFHMGIDANRVVEIRGDSTGRMHLRTVCGSPLVETVITESELVRVNHTSQTGYRIDFSRHPFSAFHRYGWLRVDRPFSLFDQNGIRFRAVIDEGSPMLLFQAPLSLSLFAGSSTTKRSPTAQLKLDGKTGLLRELLILSKSGAERFVFTDYLVNKRLGKTPFSLPAGGEVGDMTELYWNQIQLAQVGLDSGAPFFNWN